MNVSEANAVINLTRYLLGLTTLPDEEVLERLHFVNARARNRLQGAGLSPETIDQSWPGRRVAPTPEAAPEPTPITRKRGDDAPGVTVASPALALATSACADRRCAGGVTMCQGCNGYGVLRHNGRKFTLRGQGKHITPNSPTHKDCGGTGLAACGCRDLDADTTTALGLPVLTAAS